MSLCYIILLWTVNDPVALPPTHYTLGSHSTSFIHILFHPFHSSFNIHMWRGSRFDVQFISLIIMCVVCNRCFIFSLSYSSVRTTSLCLCLIFFASRQGFSSAPVI